MPRYLTMPPVRQEFDVLPHYPAERLCDRIYRDILNGVGATLDRTPFYDDDDTDVVDPVSNIKTDRFALAEDMALTHERRAASLVNESAQIIDSSVSSDVSDSAENQSVTELAATSEGGD